MLDKCPTPLHNETASNQVDGSPKNMADFYNDEAGPSEAQEAPESVEDKDEGEQTALVNQSLCPGMKVGSKFEVEVVSVLDDEYEISYLKKDEKEEEKPNRSTMEESEDRLGAMAVPPSEA